MPLDAVEEGRTVEHEREAVTAMVRGLVYERLSSLQPDEISAERAGLMLDRAGSEAWRPYQDQILRSLYQSPRGREALEVRARSGDGEVAYLAACKLMMAERAAAASEARDLVWRVYLAQSEGDSQFPPATFVVSNNCGAYKERLRALLVADRPAGRVRPLAFRDYWLCADWAGRHDLLTWSDDPHPEFAEEAAKSLEARLANDRLTSWNASLRGEDDHLWRAFLMRRNSHHPDGHSWSTLASYVGGASEDEVEVLVSWASDPRALIRHGVLHALAVIGDEWPKAREAVALALASEDLKDVAEAVNAMVYSRNAKWVDQALAQWLRTLRRDRLADERWGNLVGKAGFYFEQKHRRDFGFRSPEDRLATCGTPDLDQATLDLRAFGDPPSTRARAAVAAPAVPTVAEAKYRSNQQASRYQRAVRAVSEFIAAH